MGKRYSINYNEEVKIEPQYWGNNAFKNESKYDNYALQAFSTSNQTQENSQSTTISINQKEEENNINMQLYPFKFQWKGLGSSVILTGSFLGNWTEFKPMVKNNETEIFELVLNLPNKKHFFKFIVDNKWVCSNQYPITIDKSNNQNNFIDLTNYVPPEDLLIRKEYKKGEIKPYRSKVIVLSKKDIEKNNYNCRYPYAKELNDYTPNVITHYKPSFNIDYQSNQNKLINIAKKKYLIYKEKNNLTENNTYKKILTCPHEKLMHFYSNINDLKDKKKNYIRGCTTIRNKHKFLTVVYYKTKN